jgi:ABC-type phosphate/phosphonate transport system substrate-binding protein
MNIIKYKLVLIFLLSSVAFSQSILAQDLIFTAPPREQADASDDVYAPLAQHLSRLLGRKVVYLQPENWLTYQRDMREDKYDIVFDGPHFISWRMEHLGHEVLVKLTGILQFIMVAKADDAEINQPRDLVGRQICAISPPNLSTLSVLATYQNPVQQPVIKGVRGDMTGVLKTFGNSDCRAWIYRTAFFNGKMTPEERSKVKIIFTSAAMPNQGISVSKRLSAKEKALIIQSLTTGEGVNATQGLVKRFGGKDSKSLIPATAEEYRGHNTLLEGVIFGW